METLRTPRRSSARRLLAAVFAAAFIAGACSGDDGANPSSSTTTPPGTGPGSGPDGPGSGPGSASFSLLGLRLSEGHSLSAPVSLTAVLDGTPLTDERVADITGRLPAWVDDGSSGEDFNWPTQSLAPPRPGVTVDTPFPADENVAPPEVVTGPLHVVRRQPEGDVTIAPFVTITFDQPMVPLATLGQLAAEDVPATITPAIPGRWQWIGTRTLRFDHDSDLIDRLPMATEYRVNLPAGTKSVSGGTLASDVSWEFSTPPVTVGSLQPTGDSLPLTPVFFVTLDQRVVPSGVLGSVTVRAGDRDWPVREATSAEIEADAATRALVAGAPDGRWVAFRPVEPFPTDTAITVEIGPGTPSAEGPRTTTKEVRFEGRTYAPLEIKDVECGYGDGCTPGAEILVVFNNTLDTLLFDPASVGISPDLPGAVVAAAGNSLVVRGNTLGRTTYEITVPAGLTDVFGQTLGADERREVKVGSARPMLGQFGQPLTTLDPLAPKPGLSITTVNHDEVRLRVFSVTPSDWPNYIGYASELQYRRDGERPLPAWPEVRAATVKIAGEEDRITETVIDLSDLVGGRPGHFVVLVEPMETYSQDSRDYWSNRPTITWAQSTTIGVDASADNDELLVWATDLRTGAPLAGVSVQGLGGVPLATSGADGVARATLPSSNVETIIATLGDDTALLPNGYYGGSWQRQDVLDEARWYVFDDRGIYRPGETVSMKGWVRRLTTSGDAQLELIGADAVVRYRVVDPQGSEIATGEAEANALGGFDFQFVVKPEANLGYAYVELNLATDVVNLPNAATNHSFQIQEFRRPEFEAVTRTESAGPYVSARPATVAVDANYYSGGPVASAPVDWQVTTSAAFYSPPDWSDFTFGVWTPWWIESSTTFDRGGPIYDEGGCCYPPGTPAEVEHFSGTTDADGTHYLQIDFEAPNGTFPDLPVAVTAEATVEDVNRQAWSSTTSLLVHPADYYVGLRGARTFVRQGDPMDIQVVLTDVDGAAAVGRPVRVTAERLAWVFESGEWTEKAVDTQTCDVVSGIEPATCSFTTAIGGTYRIASTVADDQGGHSRSEMTRWVSGGDSRPARVVEQESLTVIPDQASYQPGDTAQLLVQSPFTPGEGLAIVTRNGIEETHRFQVVDGAAVVSIPIDARDIPNLGVSIEVVGVAPRIGDDGVALLDVPARPAFATGGLTLSVPPTSRTLAVTATPRDTALEPGGATTLDVTVRDAAGAPVAGAELAVVVVDEAVLALSNYTLSDPLAVFYAELPTYVYTQYGRQSIVLVNPETLSPPKSGSDGSAATTAAAAGTTAAPSGEAPTRDAADRDESLAGGESGGNGANGPTPIDVRTNFDALAVFAPEVTTGADGTVAVDVPLPDNLTRYRVMVVAVNGADEFGSAESNITARLPLMVRPSAPRFLNFGDAFELPVVVQNQTDEPMMVDVVLQTANLTTTGNIGLQVAVPANDRVEVRFPVTTNEAGTARFRVAAVSGSEADSTTIELPVYTPATAEAFATYGVIDDGAIAQPVLAPTEVVPQFGGLEITTSSTSLQALTDAVLYLTEYPYESSDAMASRIMAVTALREVLTAFDAEGLPTADEMDAAVKRDIAGLVGLQNDDGGWPFWERFKVSEPHNSIQATHALVLARAAGYTVPERTMAAALAFLGGIEGYIPSEYGQDIRDTLTAYALNVRLLAGDRDSARAEALFDERGEQLPLDAIAWLWPVITNPTMDAAIEQVIGNKAVETAGAANFTTNYGDDAYVLLYSDRRTDGLILDSLISKRPTSDLIPKVVNGLLGHRTQGRWDNAQENAFILLALKHYFDVFENATPDFVARVWLGDQYAGEHTFAGRTTDRARIAIPTSALIEAGNADIVVSKDGTGRLYYRLGLRYAPADLDLDPLDRGFVVERVYEAIDDPADVTLDAQGAWHIKAGARVRVRLTMVVESQRTHVALIDPLPAGLEILNPALATTSQLPVDDGSDLPPLGGDGSNGRDIWYPWYWTWFDHQNLRDDRAEAFAGYLSAGVYEYTYIARATTPGTFVAPPTRAEEIFAPETFGRAGTDTVVIAA